MCKISANQVTLWCSFLNMMSPPYHSHSGQNQTNFDAEIEFIKKSHKQIRWYFDVLLNMSLSLSPLSFTLWATEKSYPIKFGLSLSFNTIITYKWSKIFLFICSPFASQVWPNYFGTWWDGRSPTFFISNP